MSTRIGRTKWSYPRAWKALKPGDTIRLWGKGGNPEHGSIVVVKRTMKPFADREVELTTGFCFGEWSNMRWEKISEK